MDRPRRATRQPTKSPKLVAGEPVVRVVRRKAIANVDPEQRLKALLESSKSELTQMQISDLINSNTWNMLSDDSQSYLETLLPPTAFTSYQEILGADHPYVENGMVVDPETRLSKTELNSSVFSDSHFLAAARTFQDHLYLNWFSSGHVEKVAQFQDGILNGTLAAPWKDEVWERDNHVPAVPIHREQDVSPSSSFIIPCESTARAGGAAEVKLFMLVKHGIIRVGDVLAYKRSFIGSEVIEKDAIVQAVHPGTYAITVLTQPGAVIHLPSALLSSDPSEPSEPTRSMTIFSPTMLETGLLDIDARTEKSRRPNGNAWKCFTVWRWRAGTGFNADDVRGGRENHGTLFYLRGSYYHEI
ncbi:Asx homology domain-containing protein [Crassisporium funariophilum]|nr:Asx homology domain-containing protein [Crassisporium funariophilum]